MDNRKHKVIAISIENYWRLQNMGFAGESFNDQLNKIFEKNSIPIEDRDNTIVVVTDKKDGEE
jgi:predicted CopG family antitoxin